MPVPLTVEIIIIYCVLVAALVLFVWGKWRYDVVALLALMAVALFGLIPIGDVFSGFAHPAVITVVAVLVISKGLINSGFVDLIAKWIARVGDRTTVQLAVLTGTVALLSAFMNNVGALALLMPVGIGMARKAGKSPALFLMPLAFASHFGGWVTLIGTPPNLIISLFRAQNGGEPFGMFDFAPVGLVLASACILFVALVGWRLIPDRQPQRADSALAQIEGYLTEASVRETSKSAGKRLGEINQDSDADVTIATVIRGEERYPAPSRLRKARPGDILVLRGTPADLKKFTDDADLDLVENKQLDEGMLGSEDVSVVEAVIIPGSVMERRTARALDLRDTFGVNLLGISRQGRQLSGRLGGTRMRNGDVVLLQGARDRMPDVLSDLGCLPLAERDIQLGRPRKMILSVVIFAVAIVLTAGGVLPVQVAFPCAAVAMILAGLVSLHDAYKAVEWPVIVLIGAMIPVGLALEATGGARFIAEVLLQVGGQLAPVVALFIVMVITMVLSDLVNNAAAAVLMAPIALDIAVAIGVSVDPFLMAIVIGASTAFLTPIGHQSNTLILKPGGLKFGDYWKLGLAIEAIIIALALPMIMLVFPF